MCADEVVIRVLNLDSPPPAAQPSAPASGPAPRPGVTTKHNSAKTRPRGPKQGTALGLKDAEPWPDAVDGGVLFADITAALNRYMILPEHATVIVALWVALTYLTGAVDVLPRLLLTSPTKMCGKSRLLALIFALARRALLASSISPAAMFRAIESGEPTLLLDEMDNARLNENPELRAVLNSGHTRAGAWTVRNVGEDHESRRFSTWAPVALASIGELPDTLTSRCVRIQMKRRSQAEHVERMRESRIVGQLEPIRRQLARWCQDKAEAVGSADPTVPDGLEDREADNWSVLLAIAGAIGGVWPERARLAALASCGAGDEDAPGVQLLADIRDLFTQREADRLSSEEIVAALVEMESRPWPEWRDRKPLTARGVARLLKPFGVEPSQVRFGDATRKGYLREWFADAFARYLPLHPKQGKQPAIGAGETAISEVKHDAPVSHEEGGSDLHEHCSVSHVSDMEGIPRGDRDEKASLNAALADKGREAVGDGHA